MKPNLLHLITGLDVGGAEMMLLKILPRLQDDFNNRVCCIRGRGPVGKMLEESGIPVDYLDLHHPADIRVIFRFKKLIQKYHPDLLVSYLIHADLFGRLFGRLFGIRKIISNRRGFYLNWKILSPVDRLLSAWADAYFVQTEFARSTLRQYLMLPLDKLYVIPNAIDFHEYDFPLDQTAKKSDLGIPADHLNIVCVGNLKPGKGYEETFEAFEEVFQKLPKINLLVVGSGKEKDRYLDQIRRYSSRKNIFFLGKRDDVREILRVSDIFVLATHSEGMSNALLEAMASKLPIITTNIEVNQELIQPGISGLFVPVRDPGAIAQAMLELASNPEKRATLGSEAYKKAATSFEITQVVQLLKRTYQKVLNQ